MCGTARCSAGLCSGTWGLNAVLIAVLWCGANRLQKMQPHTTANRDMCDIAVPQPGAPHLEGGQCEASCHEEHGGGLAQVAARTDSTWMEGSHGRVIHQLTN